MSDEVKSDYRKYEDYPLKSLELEGVITSGEYEGAKFKITSLEDWMKCEILLDGKKQELVESLSIFAALGEKTRVNLKVLILPK